MQVEIWSDVVCPFCYIGKRRFEEALAAFKGNAQVQVHWKSYMLNPGQQTNPDINIHEYLASAKGWQLDYARQMNAQVTQMAETVGLNYHMDNIKVANSFKAHRLIHLAAAHNLGDAAEEALFNAYFVQGQNIDDDATLKQIGSAIGLNAAEVEQTLNTASYADQVKQDIDEAQQLGISGVPFFVFGGKYAVSGAQPAGVFLQALEKAAAEGL